MADLLNVDLGVSVLPVRVRLDISTVGSSDLLQTVTNTKNGDARFENCRVDVWGVVSVNRVWRTGKDDSWYQRFPPSSPV